MRRVILYIAATRSCDCSMFRFALLFWILTALSVEAAAPEGILSPCEQEVNARVQYLVNESLCGEIKVYEDRAAAEGRQIALNVMVIPAMISNPAPDPIVFLAGGPGQSAVSSGPYIFRQLEKLRRDRDILLVDQRGTGQSNSLACLEEFGESVFTVTLDESMAMQLGALERCLKILDADPALYTTHIAMDDLNEVREILGYPTLNLVGISYGTRAALVYARRHPETVRTMVLDAVAPTTMIIPANVAVDAEAAFDQLLSDCEAESGCNRAFPDLAEHFDALVKRLEEEPEVIHFSQPLTGKKLEAYLEAPVINRVIRGVLYDRTLSRLLPLAIEEAYSGNYAPLITFGFLTSNEDLAISAGMMASVLCSEDMQLASVNLDDGQFDNALMEVLVPVCEFWPHNAVDKSYFEPVRSDKPTLLLSGKLDPITPPKYADEALGYLNNAKHIIVPGAGHSTLTNGCIPRLVDQFIEQGSLQDIDASCAERIQRQPFFTDFAGASAERGELK
jgi:pimeloyl-ACP methyl ester carboxylesterase